MSCPGLFSSSGNVSVVPEATPTLAQRPPEATERNVQSRTNKRKVTIIATTVTVISVLLIIVGVAVYLFTRRTTADQAGGELAAHPFVEERTPSAVRGKHPQEDSSDVSSPPVATVTNSQLEIIVQHHDGNPLAVREIPPPYRTQSTQNP